ncbi:MAG TPA: hypothetical protein VN132_07370 [Bdellovibrio sp.]|nr:hypothetical protein [Bdellovibrio sp.]
MKVSSLVAIVSSLIIGSLAQASESIDSSIFLAQKKAVIAKFLKEANNPRSSVGKKIAQINRETEDGRNQNGTISMPIKRSDLQVVMIGAEEIHVPWHYAHKENGFCKTGGDSAQFMIYLTQNTGVHYASEVDTVTFVGGATETMSAPILKDGENVYCDDLGAAGDPDHNFGKISVGMSVSEIKFVPTSKIDL